MAKELSTSPQNILALLVPVFGKVEEPTLQLRESLAALPGIDGMISAKDERRLSLDDGSCQKMLHLLALCLNETRILKSSHLAEAFSVFADASRDREWYAPGSPTTSVDVEQLSGDWNLADASLTRPILDGPQIQVMSFIITTTRNGQDLSLSLCSK